MADLTLSSNPPTPGDALTTQDKADIRAGLGLGTAAVADVPASGNASAAQVVKGNDSRLTDAREWTAATATQAEAEAGTSTARLAFSPLRIFQAIAAWWAASSAAAKLAGISAGATANATDAQLRDRSTHTGFQTAGTITGLAGVATSGAYADLSGRPTLGTAAPLDVPASGNASSVQVVKGDDTRLSDARTPSGPGIAAAADKPTPVDADDFAIADSAAAFALKSLTWANIKTTLRAAFDSVYSPRGAVTSSGLTMTTARLLGRSTAGTGALEEITLGTNLSFSGTTLNAAGGGGSPGGSTTQVQFNDGGAFAGAAGLTWDKANNVLSIAAGTHTASNPLVYSETWNNAAIDFVGKSNDITNTASGANAVIERWRVGGTVVFSISTNGSILNPGGTLTVGTAPAARSIVVNSNGVTLPSNRRYLWGANTGDAGGAADAGVGRASAGVLEVNNGTAGQYRDLIVRNVIEVPPASVSPTANGQFLVEATSNTSVTLKLRGTDGVTRSVVLTLA